MSESEYGRVSEAFRDFKEKRSLNYERLLDSVFEILLKKHKLTYLYDSKCKRVSPHGENHVIHR